MSSRPFGSASGRLDRHLAVPLANSCCLKNVATKRSKQGAAFQQHFCPPKISLINLRDPNLNGAF